MYRIIGADEKEYGPISLDQLRQWIAEGRANAQTRVLVEGTAEWRTVGQIPELAALLPTAAPIAAGPAPMPSAMPGMTSPAAYAVSGPSIGLICVAVIGFLLHAANMLLKILGLGMMAASGQQNGMPTWVTMLSGSLGMVFSGIGILTSVITFAGALKMKKLENFGLAMAASIIAMIPCIGPCCFIGIPVGIWALVILSKPEVKSAFH